MLRKDTENMTLKELSKQYYDDVEMLTGLIEKQRELTKNYTGAKLHTANRYLCCLYEMRREARITAQTLEHYYDEVSSGRIYHPRPKEV